MSNSRTDKTMNFLRDFKEHLIFIIENRAKHHISTSEIKKKGYNSKEVEQRLTEVVGNGRLVSSDLNGVSLKVGAGPRVLSYCQRVGLDPYSTAMEQTEGSMSETSEQTSYLSEESSYPYPSS